MNADPDCLNKPSQTFIEQTITLSETGSSDNFLKILNNS